jgi:hypothetical protein
VQRRNVA